MLANIVYYLFGHWLGINSPIVLPFIVLAIVLLLAVAMLIVCWLSTLLSPQSRRRCLHLVFLILGLSVPQLYGNYYYNDWRPHLGKQTYQIEGVVLNRLAKPYGDVVYLGLTKVNNKPISSFWGYKKVKVLFTTSHLKTIDRIDLNDTLRLTAKLSQITGYENRFGFNYTQWLFGHRVLATGSYKQDFTQTAISDQSSQTALGKLKQVLSQYQYGKFILALVVADKSLFEQEDFKQLRNWGISHLFAISGLHIGILMGLMIIICRQLSRVLPMFCSMKFCHFVSVLLIWWYLAILDFPVSATRATLLLTFGLSLLHCRLYLQAFNLIGIVMVASLVIDPTNMVKPAWWLSVSAVCSLFLIIRLWPNSSEQTFDEVVKQEDKQEENASGCGGKAVSHVVCNNGALINKINKHTALKIVVMPFVLSFSRNKQRIISIANNVILNLQRLFILQVALTLGMLPVVIYWMQGIPLLGLVNNIIVIPLFSLVIVPAIFVGTIVELISGSKGNWIYQIVDAIFDRLWMVLDFIPYNDIWVILPEYFAWPVLVILILLVWCQSISVFFRRRWFHVIGVLCACVFIPLHSFVTTKVFNKTTTIRIFDVGQGTSVLISNNQTNMLYDLGPVFQSGSSATRHAVKPMLDNLLIDTLDLVVVSHSDTDHRGDLSVLDTLIIKQHLNGCKQLASLQHTYSQAGFELTLLWPTSAILTKAAHIEPETNSAAIEKDHTLANGIANYTDNALSCVIKIKDQSSGKSLLLTGDIDLKVEKALSEMHLANKVNLNSEIIMSSHHGSKFGSSTLFLRLVAPKLVIHSAGPNNRFNFPHPDVLNRIAELGIEQYSTSHLGEIVITLQKQTLSFGHVNFQLNMWSPYWKRQNPFSIHDQIR